MKRSLHQSTAARRTAKGKYHIPLIVCALSLCVALASFAALSAPAIAMTEEASDSLGIVDMAEVNMAEAGIATGETAAFVEAVPEMTQAPVTPEAEPAKLPEAETETKADAEPAQAELPAAASEAAPIVKSMAETVAASQAAASPESAEPAAPFVLAASAAQPEEEEAPDPEAAEAFAADAPGATGTWNGEDVTFSPLTNYIGTVEHTPATYGSGYDANGDFFDYVESQLTFDFSSLKKDDIVANNYLYYFPLPEDITVDSQLMNTLHNGFDGNVLGFKFQIVECENGQYAVQMKFEKSYIERDGYTAGDDSVIDGHVFFDTRLGSTYHREDNSIDIPFRDGVDIIIPVEDITYPENERFDADLRTEKSGGRYDPQNNTLTFTVTAGSTKGTDGEDVLITDRLGTLPTGISVKDLTVTAEKGTITPYPGWWQKNPDRVDFPFDSDKLTISPDHTNFGLTLSPLVSNEIYYITYTYTLDGKVAKDTTATLKNSVSASSDGIHHESSVDTKLTNSILNKTGWFDSSHNRILWTITLNSIGTDLVGNDKVLTDIMFAQMMQGADFTVKRDGQTADPAEYTLKRSDDGTLAGISFNAIDDGKNTGCYTISYYTEATPSLGNSEQTSIVNTADFNGGDATAGPISISDGNVEKSVASYHYNTDGTTGTIEWNTAISIPQGGILSGTVIEDVMTADQSATHYMTPAQLDALVESDAFKSLFSGHYTGIEYSTDGGKTYQAFTDAVEGSTRITAYRFTLTSAIAKPANSRVTLTYTATIDKSTATGDGCYRNSFSVGSKRGDSSLQFYRNPVDKGHGNQPGDTTITADDPYFYWYVAVKVDPNISDYTITDTMPEGVEVEEITCGASKDLTVGSDGEIAARSRNHIISLIRDENGNFPQSNGADYDAHSLSVTAKDISLTNDGGRVTAEFTAALGSAYLSKFDTVNAYSTYNTFYITYKCKLSDSLFNSVTAGKTEIKKLNNSVSVNTTGNYGGDSDEISLTVDRYNDVTRQVTKNGAWDNDRKQMDYSLVINPDGSHLGGEDMQELTLTDSIRYFKPQYEVTLDAPTVLLYTAIKNEDGSFTKGEELTSGWSWTVATAIEDSYNPNLWNDSVLTAKLPNDRALILEYSYNLIRHVSQDFGLENKAELHGIENSNTDITTNSKWIESGAGGGLESTHAYTLIKVEEGNFGALLKGAVFTLYAYNGTDYADTGHTYTSDEDGALHIKWQKNDGDYPFKKNTAYYLAETAAPAGYKLPDEPPKYHFYFSDADVAASPACMPEGYNAASGVVDLTTASAQRFVENTPVPAYTLPETGGTGTTLYSLGGLALMGMGLLGLTLRKKRERGQQQN